MQDFQNIQKIIKRELKHYPELLNNLAVLSGQMADKTPTIHINGKWTSTKLNGNNWIPLTSEENLTSSQPNFLNDTSGNIYNNIGRDNETGISENFRRSNRVVMPNKDLINRVEISGNASGIILSHDEDALRSDMPDINPAAIRNNVRPYISNKAQKSNQGEISPNIPEQSRNNTQPDILRNVPEHILSIIRDGSPRSLPENIQNDIRSTPNNVQKHFKNSIENEIPPSSTENIQNDIRSNVSDHFRNDLARNVHDDSLDNTQNGIPRYIPERSRNNIPEDIPHNAPGYIQSKFRIINPPYLQEHTQNNTQGTIPRNNQENIQNNLRNGISSNISNNIQNNIQNTIAHIENNNQYLRYISEHIRKNNQEGALRSIPEQVEDDIQGEVLRKIPGNIQSNIRDSIPQCLPDQRNIRGNISRLTQSDQEPIRNNHQNGIPPGIPANIQENTQNPFPHRFRERIEADIRSNTYVPEYIQKNFQNSIPRSVPNKHQTNIRGSNPRNIQGHSQNNPQNDISRQVPGHIQNNIRGNSPRIIPKHVQNDFQGGIPPEAQQNDIRRVPGNVAKPIKDNIRNNTLGVPENIRNTSSPRVQVKSQKLSRINVPQNKLEINQKNIRECSPDIKDLKTIQKQLKDDSPAKPTIHREENVGSLDKNGPKCNSIPLNVFPIGGYSFHVEGFPKLISIHNTYKGNLTTFRVDQIEHFGQNEKDLAEKKESATCSEMSLCLLCQLKNKPTLSTPKDQTGMSKIRKDIESERVDIQNSHNLNKKCVNQLLSTNELPPYKLSDYQPVNTNFKPHYTTQTTPAKPPPPYQTTNNAKKIQDSNSLDQLIAKTQPSFRLEPPALIDMRTGCSLRSEIDYANFVMGRLIEHHNSVFGEKSDQIDNITINEKDKNDKHKTNINRNSPSTTKSTKIDVKTIGICMKNKRIDRSVKKADNDAKTTSKNNKPSHNTNVDRSMENINEANLPKVINKQTVDTNTPNNVAIQQCNRDDNDSDKLINVSKRFGKSIGDGSSIDSHNKTNLGDKNPISSSKRTFAHDGPTSSVDALTSSSTMIPAAMTELSKMEELKNKLHQIGITDDDQKNENEALSEINFNEVGLYIPCLLKKAKSRNLGTGFAKEDLPEIKKSVYDFIKELESAVIGQNSQYKPAVIGQIPADMRPKSATLDFEKTQIDFVKSPALQKESEKSKKTTNTPELTLDSLQKQQNKNIIVEQKNNNNKKDENLLLNKSKNEDKVPEMIKAKPKKVRAKLKRIEIENSRNSGSDKSDGEDQVDDVEYTSDYLLQMNYFREIDRRRQEMLRDIENRQKSQQAAEKINIMKDLKESNDLIEKRLMKRQNKASYKKKRMRVKKIEENLESLRQVEDALKTLEEIEVDQEVDNYLNKDEDSIETILEEEAIVNKIISMDNEDIHGLNEKRFPLSKQPNREDDSFRQKHMFDKKSEAKLIDSYTKASSSKSKKSITVIDSSEKIETNDFVHNNKDSDRTELEQINSSANTTDSTERHSKNDSDKTESTDTINQSNDTHENTELKLIEDRKKTSNSTNITVNSTAKTEAKLVDTTNEKIEKNPIQLDKDIQNPSKESNVVTNHDLDSKQEIEKDDTNLQRSSTSNIDQDQDTSPTKRSISLDDSNYEPSEKKLKRYENEFRTNARLRSNNKGIDVSSDGDSSGGEASHTNLISLPDNEQASNKLDLYSRVLMSIFEKTKLMTKDELSEHHSTVYENIVYNVLNSTIANMVPLINSEATKRDKNNPHKGLSSSDTSGESGDDSNSNVSTTENNLVIDEESNESKKNEYGIENKEKITGDYLENREEITNHETGDKIRRTENASESEEDDMLEIDIRENKEYESNNSEITECSSVNKDINNYVTNHEDNTLNELSNHKDSKCYEVKMPFKADNESNIRYGKSSRSNFDQEKYDDENLVTRKSKNTDHASDDIEFGESSENDSLQDELNEENIGSHVGYELNDSCNDSSSDSTGYEGGSENDSLQYGDNEKNVVAIRDYTLNEDAAFEGKMTESDDNSEEIIVYEDKNDKNSSHLKTERENTSYELENVKNINNKEMQYEDELHLNKNETETTSEEEKVPSSANPNNFKSKWIAKNSGKRKNSKKVVTLYKSIFLSEENNVTTKSLLAESTCSPFKGFEKSFPKSKSVDVYKGTNGCSTSYGPVKRKTFLKTINARTIVNNSEMIIKQEYKFENKTKESMNLETMKEILESSNYNINTSESNIDKKTTRPCFVKLIDFQKRYSSHEARLKTDEDYDRGNTSKIRELSSPHSNGSESIFKDKEDFENFIGESSNSFFGENSKSFYGESSQTEESFEPNKKKRKLWKCMQIEENDKEKDSEEQADDRKAPTVNPLKLKLMQEKWKNIFG